MKLPKYSVDVLYTLSITVLGEDIGLVVSHYVSPDDLTLLGAADR
jgi:hypothetical protein